ncbi:Facilitated trehalose transporter Tret1-like 4 [Homarus americanus]|uniref:Facilitated trehalose transporter Tret1-like 4 n=1 Tax=Homarus americanus TaxID=6706 RepID=A0A8J5N556_HOMAM|nr:Facilitated trehalose transporter Tret1-like 4 [Homarus americanus]
MGDLAEEMKEPAGSVKEPIGSMRDPANKSHVTYQESWVGAAMPACALVGSLATGTLVDRLGRRATLLHLTWPLVISWVMIATSEGVGGVVVGRMVGGVCVGAQTAARLVFMSETVQLNLRDVLAAIPALSANLGLLVSFTAGEFLSWRGLAWLGAALSLPVVLLLLPLPETPSHLTRIGKKEASLAALRQLRCTPQDAEQEQQQISNSFSSRENNSHVSVWELVQPPNLWPVSVAASLMLAQQATGFTAIVSFTSTILDTGKEGTSNSSSTFLLGVVNVLGTFVTLFLLARIKRRYLLFVSTVMIVASLLTLSLFFWAKEAGGYISIMAKTLYLVPTLALVAYMFASSLGWRIIPWVFLGEGMPSRVRSNGVAMAVAVHWASSFLITKTFGWCMSSLGAHNTFLGYAVLTSVSYLLLHRNMPETFHLSPAQMDEIYNKAANKKQE